MLNEKLMTERIVSGINGPQLEKKITELYDCLDKIKQSLNRIEILVDDAKSYYASDAANLMQEKFNTFKSNFNNVLTNIDLYGMDLNKARVNFQMMESDAKAYLNID